MHFAMHLHPLCDVTHEHISIEPYQWSYHQLQLLLTFIPTFSILSFHSLYSNLGGTWHYLLNEDNYVELNKLMYSQRCFKLVYEKYANWLSIFQKHFLQCVQSIDKDASLLKMKIVTMSLKEICHLRKLYMVQGLLGRLLMCEGDGMLSFLFSNNSLIFDFINTPLSLLLPYCPKSKSIKQYFASHTAKRTILKNPFQL